MATRILRRSAVRQGLSTLLIVTVICLAGCDRAQRLNSVRLPPTQVLALRPHWAVVRLPYARVFTEPDRSSPIAFHVRAGDVTELLRLGRRGVTSEWFLIAAPAESNGLSGWAPAEALDLYETRQLAESASRELSLTDPEGDTGE